MSGDEWSDPATEPAGCGGLRKAVGDITAGLAATEGEKRRQDASIAATMGRERRLAITATRLPG